MLGSGHSSDRIESYLRQLGEQLGSTRLDDDVRSLHEREEGGDDPLLLE